MNAAAKRRILGVVLATLFVGFPALPTTAAPSPLASKPTPDGTQHAPPGDYGSNTYYSTDQEEAELQAVAENAKSLHAIGQGRAAKDIMVTQLSKTADVIPPPAKIGSFTVIYKRSQFTPATIKATDAAIMAAARARGHGTSFGFYYDGLLDSFLVMGNIQGRFASSLRQLAGVTVKVTADEGFQRSAD